MPSTEKTIHVETSRFYLRNIVSEDAPDLYKMDSDPRVHAFLGNETVRNIEVIYEMINKIQDQYVNNGIGRWAIIEKESNQFLGWAGLKKVTETVNGHRDYYDVGYRLLPEHWGKGVASECAAASLMYGFSSLSLEVVYAATHVENNASQRILLKNAFVQNGQFEYFNAIQNWYELEYRRWLLKGARFREDAFNIARSDRS
jgi:RimJ/RimL family protein N-acetyltransferase